MDSSQFRDAAQTSIDYITKYYDTIRERRVLSAVEPGYLRELITAKDVQEDGEPWENIQRDIDEMIMPGLTHWQSPNFLAFFPANSSYPGMLGELYSAAFTAAAFNWQCSPAITELETIVLDQVATLLNIPDDYKSSGLGGGVIQGSASEAIVTVMVAARDRYIQHYKDLWLAEDCDEEEIENRVCALRGRMVALGSDQSHSSTKKAAMITGVRYQSIKTGDCYTLDGKLLTDKLAELKSKGLEAFFLTATLGTTSTCAVDDFPSLSIALANHHSINPSLPHIWCHIDAAYAGAALVLPENQHLTRPLPTFADSFNMNMHKWLLTNFDCSPLWIKDRRHLINALSITPAYLRNHFSDSGLVTDYRDWQIPLGRRFRSLKIWFVLRTYGAKGLRTHVLNGINAGKRFTQLLMSREDMFTIVTEPRFGLNVFHVNVEGDEGVKDSREKEMARNEITKRVYEKVNAGGKIFLTSTVLDGGQGHKSIYAIRVVGGSPQLKVKDLERAFDVIKDIVEEIWEEK